MLKHLWTIIAENVVCDQATNNISLINILEQINILGVSPQSGEKGRLPIPFFIVSLWERAEISKPTVCESRIKHVDSNGEVLSESNAMIDLTQYSRVRSIQRCMGLLFSQPGRDEFVIEVREKETSGEIRDWVTVARIPIIINVTDPAKEEKKPGA